MARFDASKDMKELKLKKIKVGHLIRVFNKDDGVTFMGVVVGIDDRMDNKYLPYVSLKVYDAKSKEANLVCSAGPNYKEESLTISFIQEIDETHVKKLQIEYKKNHERPADIKPNTKYDNGIEVYVRTKKDWFKLIKTTAKMAFIEDGSRCALTNITDVRRKK